MFNPLTLRSRELMALRLLLNGRFTGCSGLELVKRSVGKLSRGAVYIVLSELESKEMIQVRKETSSTTRLPRRVYHATARGRAIFIHHWKNETGCQPNEMAFRHYV